MDLKRMFNPRPDVLPEATGEEGLVVDSTEIVERASRIRSTPEKPYADLGAAILVGDFESGRIDPPYAHYLLELLEKSE